MKVKTHQIQCTTVYNCKKQYFCCNLCLILLLFHIQLCIMHIVVTILFSILTHRIKVCEAKKLSPLPPDAYGKDVISVAWIGSVCDEPGFAYEPTFRLPHPPHDNTIAADQPEQVQHIVAEVRPCSTCWGCSCGATQNLTWRSARQETTIKDVQGERNEALKMCGYQHQVTAEHWDLSTAQLVKQCAEDRKHIIYHCSKTKKKRCT